MGLTAGLTDNPMELTQWINKIEAEISKLSVGNFDGSILGSTAVSSQAPQVTGLSLVSNLNTITVKWNPVNILNLNYYEIQVADNVGFVAPQVSRQRNTQFTYQAGDPDETYYVRVRARPVAGRPGEWSGALNTETGLVTVNHLGRGAATAITDNTIDLSGTGVMDPDVAADDPGPPTTVSAIFGNTVVRAEGGTVLPFIRFDYTLAAKTPAFPGPGFGNRWPNCGMQFDLLRTSETGDTVTTNTVNYDVAAVAIGVYDTPAMLNHVMADMPSFSLSYPEDPGIGVFAYALQVMVISDSAQNTYLRVQPMSINIEIVEFRN
jgi:hypothetical protein